VDWLGYVTQQRRWARSVLDLKLRRRVERVSRLPLASRVVSFVHGLNFLYRRVAIMLGLLILLLMLTTESLSYALCGGMSGAVGLLIGALGLQELAGIVGLMVGQPASVVLLVAGLVIMAGLVLVATELCGYPPQWDARRASPADRP
jgi:hypothetical protein